MGNDLQLHIPSSPTGHHQVRKAATFSYSTTSPISPPMNAKNHKHYQSHHHETSAFSMMEHATTVGSNVSSNGSIDSPTSSRRHNHHLTKIVSSMPNPVRITSNTIEDHVAEFRYQHNARAAKREARRISQHAHSPHRWNPENECPRSTSKPGYEEVIEDWKERDEQAWADELKKRELARRRTVTQSGGRSGDCSLEPTSVQRYEEDLWQPRKVLLEYCCLSHTRHPIWAFLNSLIAIFTVISTLRLPDALFLSLDSRFLTTCFP